MKRADLYFALVVAAFFVPFFLSRTLYEGYQSFNAAHGMVMSFVKFSILSTMGELLGLRISSGHYFRKGFGVLPRAVCGMGLFRNGYQYGFRGVFYRSACFCRLFGCR